MAFRKRVTEQCTESSIRIHKKETRSKRFHLVSWTKDVANMPPKIYFSDAQKQQDLGRKTNSANQRAKPKALKAQSSKTSNAIVTETFKPKLNKVNVNKRLNSEASSRPNVVVKKNDRNNTNNQRPISAKPKAKPATSLGNNGSSADNLKSKLETALQTANSVMRNKSHKNHNEVKQLVDSYKKQWVTEKRFLELLPKLVFE